jgi:curved DNA-binding protein CbpA
MKYQKNYYKILGIVPSATSTEIRQAYRRLASLKHPDRDPSPQATLEMQEINEAYSILGNENKRTKYDVEYFNAVHISRGNDRSAQHSVQNTKMAENPPGFLAQVITAVQIAFAALVLIEIILILLGFLIAVGWVST